MGNNIFVNYSGLQTGIGPTTSIIDVTTASSTGVPEPGIDDAGGGIAGSRVPVEETPDLVLLQREGLWVKSPATRDASGMANRHWLRNSSVRINSRDCAVPPGWP